MCSLEPCTCFSIGCVAQIGRMQRIYACTQYALDDSLKFTSRDASNSLEYVLNVLYAVLLNKIF